MNIPAYLAAYRGRTNAALSSLAVIAIAQGTAPGAFATMRRKVLAELDALDAAQPQLDRQDAAAAALLARHTAEIERLMQGYAAHGRRRHKQARKNAKRRRK